MTTSLHDVASHVGDVAGQIIDGLASGAMPQVLAPILSQDQWNTLKSALGDIEGVAIAAAQKLPTILAQLVVARFVP